MTVLTERTNDQHLPQAAENTELKQRSALDPIGRSPFLPLELFSAFISHLEMIFQAGNVHESVSLFNLEKKNDMKSSKI